MPLILSINTNINEFNNLYKYKNTINKFFKSNIKIYNTNYSLISFFTQPQEYHFVSYFINYDKSYNNSLLKLK